MPPLRSRAAAALARALTHPLARGLNLDSEEAARAHGRLIRRKGFLRRLYFRYYAALAAECSGAPPGPIIEIGSGSGFLDEVIPGVIRLDVRRGALADVRATAEALPFDEASVSCVLGLDVLHHVPDPHAFLEECARALKDEGRLVLIEPYVSPFSRLIYGSFHHEAFCPERSGWSLEESGPMSGGDAALSWVILVRDRAELARRLPALDVAQPTLHTVLLYLASGGVSLRALLPGKLFTTATALEDRIPPQLLERCATMMTAVLTRRARRDDAASPG